MSTFRVANGMEDAVETAFLNRPRLVDSTAGFLGMEVFTSANDATVFHLVTNWTDEDSFQTWHKSPAHHKSHRFMPAGLKLDASCTKVLTMKRLTGNTAGERFHETVSDYTGLLEAFLKESENVYVMAATREGQIIACNQRLSRTMKCDEADLRGSAVFALLTPHDAHQLRERIAGGERQPSDQFLLNFKGHSDAQFTLACRLDIQPGGFVLIGEATTRQNEAMHDELLQLNNEFAVLTRGHARRKREVEAAMKRLKETQSMLVHREKMALLGQMTAGVAHEINNPLAFVSSNQVALQRDFSGLLSLINLVGDSLEEIGMFSAPVRERILAAAEAIDLSYLAQSVPRKIADNLEGLERIKKIVLGLRNFSRLDEDVAKPVDVAEGISSTVRWLGPMTTGRSVAVTTRFAEIPPLFCSPGALNQAFSNVIANALQASPAGGEITVSTAAEGTICVITVEDHGCGISAENLPKIFDPFFTTKPVGEGTGLGLHIARQIVTAQGGEIRISSREGEGTCVRIEIPFAGAEKRETPMAFEEVAA